MYKNDLYELISPNNDKNSLLIIYFKRTKKYFSFFRLLLPFKLSILRIRHPTD